MNASPTVAGAPGSGNLPSCSSGSLTNLYEINYLEGSRFDDYLSGNGATNVIVGRAGADWLYGRAGTDSVLANDGTRDEAMNCGTGANDVGRRDDADPGIGTGSGSGCEIPETKPPIYSGED